MSLARAVAQVQGGMPWPIYLRSDASREAVGYPRWPLVPPAWRSLSAQETDGRAGELFM
jgi:hypothetical protein